MHIGGGVVVTNVLAPRYGSTSWFGWLLCSGAGSALGYVSGARGVSGELPVSARLVRVFGRCTWTFVAN